MENNACCSLKQQLLTWSIIGTVAFLAQVIVASVSIAEKGAAAPTDILLALSVVALMFALKTYDSYLEAGSSAADARWLIGTAVFGFVFAVINAIIGVWRLVKCTGPVNDLGNCDCPNPTTADCTAWRASCDDSADYALTVAATAISFVFVVADVALIVIGVMYRSAANKRYTAMLRNTQVSTGDARAKVALKAFKAAKKFAR